MDTALYVPFFLISLDETTSQLNQKEHLEHENGCYPFTFTPVVQAKFLPL